MVEGILITIGIIFVVVSRFLYAMYDITLGGDNFNSFKGALAVVTDFIGTALVVFSALSYSGIYKIFG